MPGAFSPWIRNKQHFPARRAVERLQCGLHVELDDMGMVESLHLCVFYWVLNDVFARINHEGRYATGGRLPACRPFLT